MAKLIVNPTSSARREIPLARALLSIGRDPSNDVVLPDAMVSRRHAVIEYRGTQYFIRDCNSSNGSLVNGDRVSERSLRDGDLVAIGTARLLFREEMAPEDAAAKVVQHPSAPRLQCPACQADYRKGDVFCRQCGGALAPASPVQAVCAACGTVVPLPARFCNACGKSLDVEAARPDATRPHAIPAEAAPGADAAARVTLPPPAPVAEPRAAPEGAAAQPAARGAAPRPMPAPAGPAPRPVDVGAAATAVPGPGGMPRPMPSPAAGPRPAPVPGPKDTRVQPLGADAPPAGFGARLLAGLIDGAVVSVVQLTVLAPGFFYWWSREAPRSSADVGFWPILLSLALVPLALGLGALYFIYFWGVKGATPGKRLLDLVVQAEDGSHPIGVPRASMRLLGYILSGALFGIGFLMIALGGGALHDRLAGTRVARWRRT
jgi:uncharacterized RDD family membrane protein YckC